MARPKIEKSICAVPEYCEFFPSNCKKDDVVVMTYEEYETIMLIDYQNLQQEECAARMDASRTTIQLIYTSARNKLADFIVNGKTLQIEGGSYKLCENRNTQCKKGHCNKCCQNGKN